MCVPISHHAKFISTYPWRCESPGTPCLLGRDDSDSLFGGVWAANGTCLTWSFIGQKCPPCDPSIYSRLSIVGGRTALAVRLFLWLQRSTGDAMWHVRRMTTPATESASAVCSSASLRGVIRRFARACHPHRAVRLGIEVVGNMTRLSSL